MFKALPGLTLVHQTFLEQRVIIYTEQVAQAAFPLFNLWLLSGFHCRVGFMYPQYSYISCGFSLFSLYIHTFFVFTPSFKRESTCVSVRIYYLQPEFWQGIRIYRSNVRSSILSTVGVTRSLHFFELPQVFFFFFFPCFSLQFCNFVTGN